MAFDLDKMDIDLENLEEEVKKADEEQGEFEKLPDGVYVMELQSITSKVNSNGKAFFSLEWQVEEGDEKFGGRKAWQNVYVNNAKCISISKGTFATLYPEDKKPTIEFKNYDQYSELVETQIFNEVCNTYAYEIKISTNKNNYQQFKILNILDF